jgi:hypothetical protein
MANEDMGAPTAAPDDEEPVTSGDATGIAELAPRSDVPEGEDDIPPAPLWAMRTRMHSLRHLDPGEEGRIRRRLGADDDAVYVIDDGPDHCMVGRRVGEAPDGCVYCLVARISLEEYADVVAGVVALTEVFSDARDISLCGVFEQDEASSNVFLVQHYRRPRDVPADYLPSSPFLEFTDDADGES